MKRKIMNFLKSPAGRRFLIWAVPVVISFIANRLSKDDKKSAKKRK